MSSLLFRVGVALTDFKRQTAEEILAAMKARSVDLVSDQRVLLLQTEVQLLMAQGKHAWHRAQPDVTLDKYEQAYQRVLSKTPNDLESEAIELEESAYAFGQQLQDKKESAGAGQMAIKLFRLVSAIHSEWRWLHFHWSLLFSRLLICFRLFPYRA